MANDQEPVEAPAKPAEPPKPEQPPDFDPEDEELYGRFRGWMDRYFGDLEKEVDSEPVPAGNGATGTPAPTGGARKPKAAKAVEPKVEEPAVEAIPSGGSLLHLIFGTPKQSRSR